MQLKFDKKKWDKCNGSPKTCHKRCNGILKLSKSANLVLKLVMKV